MTVESIGGLIDRSSYAVRAKAQELGINRMLRGGGGYNQSKKHPQSDIELVRKLHQCGVPRRDIAVKREMSLGMINQYVYFDRRAHEV